ncbi:MAG: hypothetical protein IKM59_05440 [Oscillospiraceae bacterium]|nr:hypothetical protein [Oscillospiraceae bacterium]
MRGKNKCKILKQIRQRIADENDIPLITQECTYQGECSGTCPRCESELRYLEQQLARRQALGKAVTVAALSLTLMVGATGCGTELVGDVPYVPAISAPENTGDEKVGNDGSLTPLPVGDTCTEDTLLGMLPAETEEIVELDGDVAYIPVIETVETSEFPGAPTEGTGGTQLLPVGPESTEASNGNGNG